MHRLLLRQIKRHLKQDGEIDAHWHNLLKAISDRYVELDREVALMENALEVNSKELTEVNNNMRLQNSAFTTILDTLSDGLYTVDQNFSVLFINKSAQHILGLSDSVLIGASAHQTFHHSYPDGRLYAQADCPIQKTLTEGITTSGEDNLIHQDGRFIPVTFSSVPLPLADGISTGALVVFQDISQRHLAEQLISLQQEAINATVGMIKTDTAGKINFVNNKFCTMSAYSQATLLGRNINMLNPEAPPFAYIDTLWDTLKNGLTWHGEMCQRNSSGELFWTDTTIIPILDIASQKHTGYLSVNLDISSIKRSEERLSFIAWHDSLTGLPNRRMLEDRLEQAMARAQRTNTLLAICFLDLDEFKPVNDEYGHDVGDTLLIEVSKRLTEMIRGDDTAARLGGDEFVLLLNDIADIDELQVIMGRLLNVLSVPYVINLNHITLSASIGSVLYPFDNADADTLLRHADQAMYQAKQRGRNQHQMFDVSLDTQIIVGHQTIKGVKKALQSDELVLHYQPKVNMRTGDVVGMEALLRWQHPEQGMIPPLDFLPQVEKTELIIDIGMWVIDQALQQIIIWQQAGKAWTVSVNIAALHFQNKHFLRDLKAALHRHASASPHLLEIEILESVALGDIHQVHQLIRDCQALGVSFSLDDFGTGYSSLSYLKQLPAETIKIDQSFVRDILDDKDDLALVEAVIGIGRVFNRRIVAEGVETPEHGALLIRLGCHLAQGYGIAKPMPAAQILDWAAVYVADSVWSMWADTQWELNDFPLLVAQHDYSKWVKHLVLSVEHHNINLSQTEVSNMHQCRFWHWYCGYGARHYGKLPEFLAVAPLYNQVHEIGIAIIHACEGDDTTQAQALCNDLLATKDHILMLLANLQHAAPLHNGQLVAR